MAPCDAQAEIRRLSQQVRMLTNERDIAVPLAGQLGKELHATLERVEQLTRALQLAIELVVNDEDRRRLMDALAAQSAAAQQHSATGDGVAGE